MHNMSMFRNTLLAAAIAALVAPAFAAEWISDFDAAKAQAAKDGKAILADFTGSDWCGWCIRLRQSVLDTPEFEAYAKDKFVLAEIDVPHAPKLSPEQLEKNKQLCMQYKVEAFPTLLVMDAQGRVMGGFAGGRTTLQEVQAPLNKGLENLQLSKLAATQQGAAKLETLVKIYKNMPKDLRKQSSDMRDEILALDPENSSGMRDIFAAEQQQERFAAELMTAQTEAQAIAMLERMKNEALPANKSGVLVQLFQLKMESANTVEDLMAAKALLLEAAEYAPAKRKASMQKAAAQQFANPELLLQKIKTFRGQGQ